MAFALHGAARGAQGWPYRRCPLKGTQPPPPCYAEALKHKVEVLDGHCAAVGRDPAEIERSLDCQMVIRDTAEAAQRAWLEYMVTNRTPADRETPWVGSPEQIAERILAYRAIGFRTVNVEVPYPYDPETVDRLIAEVKPLVDGA